MLAQEMVIFSKRCKIHTKQKMVVPAAHWTFSHSLLCCTLSSSAFGALLWVFRVSLFITSSKKQLLGSKILNWRAFNYIINWVSSCTSVVRSCTYCVYLVRRRVLDIQHMIHIYIHIYICHRNSAIQLTSVGLTHTHPNEWFLLVKHKWGAFIRIVTMRPEYLQQSTYI